MLRTFIQVLALALSIMSAFFLIKGVMQLPANDIARLSSTYLGYNITTAQSYCHQRADYVVGFTLLLLGVILQGANMLWMYRIKDFGVSKAGAINAVIVAIVLFVIAHSVSNRIYNTCYKHVEKILKQEK